MSGQFYNPVEIIFKRNSFNQIVKEFENKATVVVTTKGTINRFLGNFLIQNIKDKYTVIDECVENPTFVNIEKIYKKIDHKNFNQVIAIGGGSTLDSAKILSIYEKNEEFQKLKELIINPSNSEKFKSLPIIAVPTTAGTGSEVTPWATIWDDVNKKKYSIHQSYLWPVKAYLDPMLTLTMPKHITIQTSLDALSHSLESIWNTNRNPTSQKYALKAIDLILDNLTYLIEDLGNVSLRTKIQEASLYAGLAFSNTKTALAHALSYYLTSHKNIPHGIACSFTLPLILENFIAQNINGPLNEVHLRKVNLLYKKLAISLDIADYGVSKEEFEHYFQTSCMSDRIKNSVIDLDFIKEKLLKTYKE